MASKYSPRPCRQCGTTFFPKHRQARRAQVFCTRKCANVATLAARLVPRRLRSCDQCGREFRTFAANARRCSKRCRDRATNRRKDLQRRGIRVVGDYSRLSVFRRDKGVCWICKEKVQFATSTVDHLVPLSKGGEDSARNVRLAHRSCNSSRGNRSIEPMLEVA